MEYGRFTGHSGNKLTVTSPYPEGYTAASHDPLVLLERIPCLKISLTPPLEIRSDQNRIFQKARVLWESG